ncbi:hypothetical protein ERO13_D01G206966v2 [Gossypium hirsutum]|uniref:Uncharacterized protein n=1 Tax=Gossypium mustelinum TaxID=34275 RepID=A0A5D2WBQ0_GOSMU|nr:hypothetical protein ERO13_D01G206966v2 [Gossypium hirsutum]TYI98968.1 hypothetical protein E1A91_D01G253600v1 [Gossypium mustelinum]
MPARGRRKHREMEDLPQRYAEAIDPCLSEEEDGETLQGEALEVKNKTRLQEENIIALVNYVLTFFFC